VRLSRLSKKSTIVSSLGCRLPPRFFSSRLKAAQTHTRASAWCYFASFLPSSKPAAGWVDIHGNLVSSDKANHMMSLEFLGNVLTLMLFSI
jgi:hypothetical protein